MHSYICDCIKRFQTRDHTSTYTSLCGFLPQSIWKYCCIETCFSRSIYKFNTTKMHQDYTVVNATRLKHCQPHPKSTAPNRLSLFFIDDIITCSKNIFSTAQQTSRFHSWNFFSAPLLSSLNEAHPSLSISFIGARRLLNLYSSPHLNMFFWSCYARAGLF